MNGTATTVLEAIQELFGTATRKLDGSDVTQEMEVIQREIPILQDREPLTETLLARQLITRAANQALRSIDHAQNVLEPSRCDAIAEAIETCSTPKDEHLGLDSWFDPRSWTAPGIHGVSEKTFFLGICAYFIDAQEAGLEKALGKNWRCELYQLSHKH